jgi:hypothetical protein
MSCSGWIGRLRLAARALDLRLKLDPMQTVCHGDAKGANVVYACGGQPGGQPVPLVYDFQCVLRSRRRARVTRCACTAARQLRLRTWLTSATWRHQNRKRRCCCSTTTLSCRGCCRRKETRRPGLFLLLCTKPEIPNTQLSLSALKTSFELALCDWRRFSEVGLGGWGHSSANQRVQALLRRVDGGIALPSEEAYVDAVFREFPV